MSPNEQHPPDEQAVSLEQLSQTFARLFAQAAPEAPASELGGGLSQAEVVVNAGDEEGATARAGDLPHLPDWSQDTDPRDVSPLSIVEAMLFVGDPANSALTAEQAAAVMRGVTADDVHEAVRQLNQRYASQQRPCRIVSDGAGYRLTLRPEYRRLQEKYQGKVRQARLSQAAIEVLSLVAYNEPLRGEEVNRLRSAASGGVLAQLVRRQLLMIERNEEHPHQPFYRTTQRFLDLFGLESLTDLPQSQDVENK